MKIFTKIFLSVFCFVSVVVCVLSFIMIRNQVMDVEKELVKQVVTLGDFLSTQIETGFIQSQLPYESLSKLTKSENFLFWWIVKDDGIIYRADDTAYMGTKAQEYFPGASKLPPNQSVYLDKSENYGIYQSTLKYGNNDWKFWYGFSMKSIGTIRNNIILNSVTVIAGSFVILGIALYFMVSFFLKPIQSLLEGVKEISKGNLDYAVDIRTGDELGDLAKAFGQMTVDLKKGKQTLEEYNKKLEQQVTERTGTLRQKMDELERINKQMVDRELKMIELKKRISELEASHTGTT
jgi:methyl-accepting chemotaxis protein